MTQSICKPKLTQLNCPFSILQRLISEYCMYISFFLSLVLLTLLIYIGAALVPRFFDNSNINQKQTQLLLPQTLTQLLYASFQLLGVCFHTLVDQELHEPQTMSCRLLVLLKSLQVLPRSLDRDVLLFSPDMQDAFELDGHQVCESVLPLQLLEALDSLSQIAPGLEQVRQLHVHQAEVRHHLGQDRVQVHQLLLFYLLRHVQVLQQLLLGYVKGVLGILQVLLGDGVVLGPDVQVGGDLKQAGHLYAERLLHALDGSYGPLDLRDGLCDPTLPQEDERLVPADIGQDVELHISGVLAQVLLDLLVGPHLLRWVDLGLADDVEHLHQVLGLVVLAEDCGIGPLRELREQVRVDFGSDDGEAIDESEQPGGEHGAWVCIINKDRQEQ